MQNQNKSRRLPHTCNDCDSWPCLAPASARMDTSGVSVRSLGETHTQCLLDYRSWNVGSTEVKVGPWAGFDFRASRGRVQPGISDFRSDHPFLSPGPCLSEKSVIVPLVLGSILFWFRLVLVVPPSGEVAWGRGVKGGPHKKVQIPNQVFDVNNMCCVFQLRWVVHKSPPNQPIAYKLACAVKGSVPFLLHVSRPADSKYM
jgi:hypothetical protein